MQMHGESAGQAGSCVAPLVAEAFRMGRPCLVWCDGEDITALIGDDGDTADELLKLAPRVLPEIV